MTKIKIKNTSEGPKIVNAQPVATLQAGEEGEFEINDAELKSARASGWFEIGSKPKA